MEEAVRPLVVVIRPLEEARLQVVALPLVVVVRPRVEALPQVVVRPLEEEVVHPQVVAILPLEEEAVHHLVVMIVLQEEALLRPKLNHLQETAIRLQAEAACQILQAFLL